MNEWDTIWKSKPRWNSSETELQHRQKTDSWLYQLESVGVKLQNENDKLNNENLEQNIQRVKAEDKLYEIKNKCYEFESSHLRDVILTIMGFDGYA